MKKLYCETFDTRGISDFIEEARRQYYAEDNDAYRLMMNVGKAIAYAEASWAMDIITEDQAHTLIAQAEDIMEEIIA